MRRSLRILFFDGKDVRYPRALGQLIQRGVDPQTAVRLLDTVPFAGQNLADKHAEIMNKAGEAITAGAKKVGGAVVAGAARTSELVKQADKAIGKVGGGEEDCEWITIQGARGTARICIDHEGTIQKGPPELAGQDAGTLTRDTQRVERAKGMAKQKKEEAEKREKAAQNKVRDWADRADDLASVAMSFAGGDFAMGMGSMTTKFLAERFGFVKKATNGLRDWLTNRYGQVGATAIVISGMAAMKGADFLVPGLGTAMGFVPGGHLLSALPIVAAIETLRFAVKEGKHIAHGFKRLTGYLGSKGDPKAPVVTKGVSGKRKGKAGFADKPTKKSKADKAFKQLSDKDIEKLGRTFMENIKKAIMEDWNKHKGEWKDIAKKLKESKKEKPAKEKPAKEKPAKSNKE